MNRAFHDVFGIPDAFAGIELAGRTDTSILGDAFARMQRRSLLHRFRQPRKAFGIGDPVWDSSVDDQIIIKFHLVGGR